MRNSQSGVNAHSATRVLDNSKLDKSLTNALAKSGIVLPSGGLKAACAGFGNLGQCVAALHVAKNLNLPGGFAALKSRITGADAVSLGKAIQQVSPNTNSKAQVKAANKAAHADLRGVG